MSNDVDRSQPYLNNQDCMNNDNNINNTNNNDCNTNLTRNPNINLNRDAHIDLLNQDETGSVKNSNLFHNDSIETIPSGPLRPVESYSLNGTELADHSYTSQASNSAQPYWHYSYESQLRMGVGGGGGGTTSNLGCPVSSTSDSSTCTSVMEPNPFVHPQLHLQRNEHGHLHHHPDLNMYQNMLNIPLQAQSHHHYLEQSQSCMPNSGEFNSYLSNDSYLRLNEYGKNG